MIRLKTAALAILAFGLGADVAPAEEFAANNWLEGSDPMSAIGYVEWAKHVAERTNGDITFKVFTGGSLIPPTEVLPGLRNGLASVGYHAGTYTPRDLPATNVVAAMAAINSDMLVTMAATTDMSFNNPDIQAEYKKVGLVYGGGYSSPPYNLICNQEIRSLADLKAAKVRASGGVTNRWLQSVGASIVNIPSSETYQAIERGVIACSLNAVQALKYRSWWDVAHFVTDLPVGPYYAGALYLYNKDFWDQHSPEQRRILLEEAAKSAVAVIFAFQMNTDATEAEMGAKGVTVITPDSDLVEATTTFFAQDADALPLIMSESTGLTPEIIERTVADYKTKLDKWTALIGGIDRTDQDAVAALLISEIFSKVDVAH